MEKHQSLNVWRYYRIIHLNSRTLPMMKVSCAQKHKDTALMTLFKTLVFLFVYGWYAELMCSLVQLNRNSSCHN